MGMTAHDPQFAREQRGILRWFGFGAAPRSDELEDGNAPGEAADIDPRERQRRQLLTDIGSFLLTHRLEVNLYTLAIAHDIITGTDHRLARQIEARVGAREPVTLEWLEEARRGAGQGDGAAMLNALMAKLETSLTDFAETTGTARLATSEYNSVLEAHVGELEQNSKAGVAITELATIAKVMLDHTRKIEQEMSRSEMQTRAMQSNLDDARRKAEMDHLTGLPNRRAFECAFDKELEAAKEAGEPLCVAFVDIDHFKKVNDTHGHDSGDRVLKAVAQTLAKISGDKCHVARHGGEEFVVLIRGKKLEEAWTVLDGARQAMAERRLVNRATDMPFGQVTFSGGIADVFAYRCHRDALKAADESLYVAKAQGRNCIVFAETTAGKIAV